jgi:hypothetical protein
MEAKRADCAELARSESLADPIVRVIEVSLGAIAAIGIILSFGMRRLQWLSLLLLGPLWRGLRRPPRVCVGLDGIAHRAFRSTFHHPFELLENADVERVSNHTCRVIIGDHQFEWSKPFGIDEAERIGLRQWLSSAIEEAKEGAALSRQFSVNLETIADADDSTLAQLSRGLGTSIDVRVLAIATLVLRGAKEVAEIHGVTGHILSRDTRRLIKRAFRVTSMEDLAELKRCLDLPQVGLSSCVQRQG